MTVNYGKRILITESKSKNGGKLKTRTALDIGYELSRDITLIDIKNLAKYKILSNG